MAIDTIFKRATRVRELHARGYIPTMIAQELKVSMAFIKDILAESEATEELPDGCEYVPAMDVPKPVRRDWHKIAAALKSTPYGMVMKVSFEGAAGKNRKVQASYARQRLAELDVPVTLTYDADSMYIALVQDAKSDVLN